LQLISAYPLFVYSIRHARKLGIPNSNIIVSSDDDEILEVAEQYKACPHRRPENISGDDSPTEACLINAWESHQRCDTVLTLQPTSPIRHTLKEFVKTYFEGDFDSGLTTTKFYNFFWHKADWIGADLWSATYDYKNRLMRQTMDPSDFMYFDNGNAYLSNAEMLAETKCRLGTKVHVFSIAEIEGMQIDTCEDLETFRNIKEEYFFRGGKI